MLLIVILNQGGPYGDREEIRTSGLDRTSEVREEREFADVRGERTGSDRRAADRPTPSPPGRAPHARALSPL